MMRKVRALWMLVIFLFAIPSYASEESCEQTLTRAASNEYRDEMLGEVEITCSFSSSTGIGPWEFQGQLKVRPDPILSGDAIAQNGRRFTGEIFLQDADKSVLGFDGTFRYSENEEYRLKNHILERSLFRDKTEQKFKYTNGTEAVYSYSESTNKIHGPVKITDSRGVVYIGTFEDGLGADQAREIGLNGEEYLHGGSLAYYGGGRWGICRQVRSRVSSCDYPIGISYPPFEVLLNRKFQIAEELTQRIIEEEQAVSKSLTSKDILGKKLRVTYQYYESRGLEFTLISSALLHASTLEYKAKIKCYDSWGDQLIVLYSPGEAYATGKIKASSSRNVQLPRWLPDLNPEATNLNLIEEKARERTLGYNVSGFGNLLSSFSYGGIGEKLRTNITEYTKNLEEIKNFQENGRRGTNPLVSWGYLTQTIIGKANVEVLGKASECELLDARFKRSSL